MNNTEELKRQLKAALTEKPLDYGRVLTLSSELARQDQENVRFSVDASHISRLGLELVAKKETAVAELVKNGYDADATEVTLIFQNSQHPGGTLEIRDNGVGMTRQQLIDGFMRLSTPHKIDQPQSERYKRTRAGRKGIGRFSAQRLGTQLTVKTQQLDSPVAFQITIHWEDFAENRELISISNRIVTVDPKDQEAGTTLIIDNLREAWSEAEIKRVYRYVSELLQPFPLSQNIIRKTPDDPGFKAVFYQQLAGENTVIADEETMIFKYALADIAGQVDNHGVASWSLRSQRYHIDDTGQQIGLETNPSQVLKAVFFKAYFFIDHPDLLPKIVRSQVRDILRKQGGIKLYRNGIRVPPYGEPYNDWLGLDARESLDRQTPIPFRNNTFLGFVEITDPNGEHFQETSSREGLIENEAFKELQTFIFRALTAAVRRIWEARSTERLSKSSASASAKTKEPEPAKESHEIVKSLETVVGNLDLGSPTGEEIKERILKLGETSQTVLEENNMLRILASLGLTMGEFTHEIRHPLTAMVANLMRLKTYLANKPEALNICAGITANLTSLQSYARYFDDAIIANAHHTLEVQELRDIINAFESVITPELQRKQIELTKQILGYDLFTRPMHRSEWTSILFNLFTNAVKAIKRAKPKVGKLLIRAGEAGNRLFLEFADNGSGIPEEYRDRIFNAFFTTSAPPSPYASETEQLTGSGLGLKIVKDIVESAGGEILLVTPPDGYVTCFRIELPKATQEEIPEDAY
jgi:signal transduction histidine kinase